MTTETELRARIAELEAAQARAEALNQIACDLNTARDANELLQTLAWPAQEAGAAKATLLFIDLDEAGDPAWIEIVACQQWTDTLTAAPIGSRFYLPEYPLSDLWMDSPDKAQLISDVATSERVDENLAELLAQGGICALVVIPLTRAGRWTGLLTFSWDKVHEHSPREVEIYTALIGLVSSAVERLRLASDLEKIVAERASEAFILSTLADNSPDPIVLSDMEAKIIYANRAFYELVGWDETRDLVGTPFHTFWTEEQKPAMIETAIPQAMAGGWSGEVQMKHSDGSIMDTHQTLFPLPDADGNMVIGVTFIRNVTAHKQAQAELEAFAQRLALLVEQTPLAVIEWDLDFRVTQWNRAAERIFGYTREEAIGQTPVELIVPENAREHVNQVWKTLVEEKKVALSTNENSTKSGEVIVCEWTNAPMIDANGEIVGVASIAQDATEREKTAKELQEQQALLHQVVDSFPGFVFVKDREGRFTLANQALAEQYRTNVKEMIGKTDADFNPHPEEVEQFLRDDRQVMDSLQEKFIPEETITDAMGNVRWLQTSKRPLLDENGVSASSVLGVCSDITRRKQAEQERESLQQEIIETQQLALQELSTPVIPVLDTPQGGIIVMPLIGSIDSARAQDITRALLAGIREHQATIVILDITGVSIVDSGVANHLNKTIRAARLKGARAIITGISEAVAETIVDLGIDWGGIDTLSDLQTGLIAALNSMGLRLSPIRSK